MSSPGFSTLGSTGAIEKQKGGHEGEKRVFVPLGPLGLIILRHFPKKFVNAALPRSAKNIAERPISANTELKFCSVFACYLSMYC